MSVILSKSHLFNIFGDVAYYIYPHYINSYLDDWRNEHKQRFRDALSFIKQPTYNIFIHHCYLPNVLNLRFALNHLPVELYYSPHYPKYFNLFRLFLNTKPWASLSSIYFENGLVYFTYEYFFSNKHIAFIKIELNDDQLTSLEDLEFPPIVNVYLDIPSLRFFFLRYKFLFSLIKGNL
jgi:hypothetical protein